MSIYQVRAIPVNDDNTYSVVPTIIVYENIQPFNDVVSENIDDRNVSMEMSHEISQELPQDKNNHSKLYFDNEISRQRYLFNYRSEDEIFLETHSREELIQKRNEEHIESILNSVYNNENKIYDEISHLSHGQFVDTKTYDIMYIWHIERFILNDNDMHGDFNFIYSRSSIKRRLIMISRLYYRKHHTPLLSYDSSIIYRVDDFIRKALIKNIVYRRNTMSFFLYKSLFIRDEVAYWKEILLKEYNEYKSFYIENVINQNKLKNIEIERRETKMK